MNFKLPKLSTLNLTDDSKLNLIITGAVAAGAVYYAFKYVAHANKAKAYAVDSIPSMINERITLWIAKHSVDQNTTAHLDTIRQQVQAHMIQLQQTVAERQNGLITRDEYKKRLIEVAKQVADELNIALKPLQDRTHTQPLNIDSTKPFGPQIRQYVHDLTRGYRQTFTH